MRWYLSNQSYPEMRGIDSFWQRQLTWWKAFISSLTDGKMWGFVFVVLALSCLGGAVNLFVDVAGLLGANSTPLTAVVDFAVVLITIGAAVSLSLTWGGDIIRPHLRRVNPRCRASCPECGFWLRSQLESDRRIFQCPECGQWLNRRPFEEPYPFDVRPTPSAIAFEQAEKSGDKWE